MVIHLFMAVALVCCALLYFSFNNIGCSLFASGFLVLALVNVHCAAMLRGR